MNTQTIRKSKIIYKLPTVTQQLNNIYIAAPFFDGVVDTIPEQVDRVDSVKKFLEFNPTVAKIFSPKDHQSQIRPTFGKEWRKDTFANDVKHVEKADVIVAIMAYNKNGSLDDGVAFEVGLAYSLGIPVVYITEEHENLNTNLMIAESGKAFLSDPLSLVEYNFNKLPQNTYIGNVL